MLSFNLFRRYLKLSRGVFDKKSGNVSFLYDPKQIVNKNLRKIANKLGFKVASLNSVHQVHGSKILIIKNKTQSVSPDSQFDGLITNVPEKFLLIKTADCYPVFLFDPQKNVVGLIHVGWKGASLKIHHSALEIFTQQFGSRLQDIIVGIGPGICSQCYSFETKPSQAGQNDWQQHITKASGLWHVDIKGYLLDQLEQIGIKSEHIEAMNICTFKNHQFFSHRRSLKTGEEEGRFASIIGLKS